jgi:hypothetical protein
VSTAAGEPLPPGSIAIGAVVRGAAPRLVRDAFGPLAAFFAGWKLIGLGAGIGLAALFGVLVFVHERRQGRPAMVVRLALVLVAIRATVGLSSGSATTYLAQEIGIDVLLGSAVLASLASARPFAARFAGDVLPMTDELLDSDEFCGAMRTITLVWAVYFFSRAAVRLVALLSLGTNAYALVIALTDAPFLVVLLAWSVRHTIGVFRRSPEWGPLMAAARAQAEG